MQSQIGVIAATWKCLLAMPLMSVLSAQSADEGFPCREARASIWVAETSIAKDRAVSS